VCGTAVDKGLYHPSVVGRGRGVGGRLVDGRLWVVDLGVVGRRGDVVERRVVEGGGGHVVDHWGRLVWVVGGVVVGSRVTVAVTFLPRIETDLWDGDSIARHQRVTENINLRHWETTPSRR